jgi:hypothetical protein
LRVASMLALVALTLGIYAAHCREWDDRAEPSSAVLTDCRPHSTLLLARRWRG